MDDKTPEEVIALAKQCGAQRAEGWHKWTFTYDQLQAFIAALTAAQEPVAYMVFWGIGEKRPHYPAYNTREIAELAASQIKSDTEIRPLYATIAQPEQLAAEPVKGKNYEQGLWSMRNYEAMLEDGSKAQPVQPASPQQSQAVMPDFQQYVPEYLGLIPFMKPHDRTGGWVNLNDVQAAWPQPKQPSQDARLLKALQAAQRAIGSMKQTAETAGAGGDKRMLQEACESISNEGLAAFTAINVAIAATS